MAPEFVTQEQCAASKVSCKEFRTLENQNLVLNLRAWVKEEIRDLDSRIEERFQELLKTLGYEEPQGTKADTAVPADHEHHPDRREEDKKLRERAMDWTRENFTVILLVLLAALAGSTLEPFGKRILEAWTTFVVKMLS